MKLLSFFGRRWVQVVLALGVLAGAAGVWMLLHPAAFWLQPWRPQTELVGNRFVFGPYPIEKDFQALKQKGVTTIVSLLDSDLPYEMVLLGQEQALAEKYGMKVLNFPMASILGQSFGKDYLANSRAAAQAAVKDGGTVYIHCYLGLHRAANVRKLLEQYSGTAAGTYEGTRPKDRTPDRLALDRADVAFMEGRMEDALREAAAIQVRTAQSMMLEAWANYRLNRIDEAQALFTQVLAEKPDATDAVSGLGLCALRRNDLPEAEKRFGEVLARSPDDLQAVEGLGHVRYRQGRSVEARQLFERVLERNPQNEEVRQILDKLRLSARRAVIVVVDGLRPEAIMQAPAPQMAEVMAGGATTLTAHAVGVADTLPSLATIVTGRSPQQHGLLEVGGTGGLSLPTLFTRMHEAGGRSALYFGKRQLAQLAPAGLVQVSQGPTSEADGADGLALAGQFAAEARQRPFDLAVIHLRDPDMAGHAYGFASPQYLDAVRRADQAVGRIREVVAATTGRTTLILTADHAGAGRRHGEDTPASFVVPFTCQGPRVRRGPIQETVTLLDVAPTVLAALGLPALPQAEGKPVGACVASA